MARTLFNSKTVEDVEFCLNRGDDIETAFGGGGWTPFIHHCQKGNIDVVLSLINRGCDINKRHFSGMNGLDYVCDQGHYDLLLRLLNLPQIRNLINPIGMRSPLAFCCSRGHCDIFDVLIENGADVNHKDQFDNSHLRYAMSNNNPVIIRHLLDNGADVNHVNLNNDTCIHTCDITLECLDILLCYGGLALINKQDNGGYTPLYVAVDCGNIDIISRLLDCGADPDISDFEGITPLEYAKSIENNEAYSLDFINKIKAIINLLS